MSSKKNKKTVVVKSETSGKAKPKHVKQDLFKTPFWSAYKWGLLIISLLTVGIYYQSTGFDYVLDDKIVITDNKYVAEGLSGIGKILTTESFSGYFGEQRDLLVGGRYRPLSIVTFAIENQFFGNNPYVGHLVNILFYITCILLLMKVMAIMFPLSSDKKWYWSIPFLSGLLFALHPLHVEVVANVKGRDEIMTMMGAFGALYFSFKYANKPEVKWLILSGIVMFLGLLSKENAITFIAVIPATIYFFTKSDRRTIFMSVLPLIIASIIYLLMRYQAIGYFLSTGKEITNLMNNPFVEMNGSERLATIMYTLGLYLKLLFFPHPLTHDYYPYHIPIMNWAKAGTLISFLLYLMLAVIMFKGWRQKFVPSYLIFFLLATISIVSNIVFPVGTFMNERFVFISSLAACIFISWLAVDMINKWSPVQIKNISIPGVLLILPFIAGFTWKTIDRIPVWRNGFDLNKSAVEVSVNSARANMFMGTAYFNKYRDTEDPAEKMSLLDSASVYIERALKIHPNYGDGLHMKGGVAAEYYRQNYDLEALLDAFYFVGQQRINNEFFLQYMEYLSKQPAVRQRMEQFFIDLAYRYHFLEMKSPSNAHYLLTKGLEYNPGSAKMHLAMGRIFEQAGNTAKATEHYNQARALDPGAQL